MASTENAPVSAAGWLADSWPAFADAAPVIVNPRAPVGAVLAWCHAEDVSLRAVCELLCAAGEGIECEDLGNTLMHRLRPLERVLGSVVDGEAAAPRLGGRGRSG